MIETKIILDSINDYGNRLTTFELHYPYFIHQEMMTHRRISMPGQWDSFSINASSTRAVPTEKLIREVRSDELRAKPVRWGKKQKGMQSDIELSEDEKQMMEIKWKEAALNAATSAEQMTKLGGDKQTVNRILSPFIHIHVVCTATEYMNFFGLRLDKGADPTMQALAISMWKNYKESTPLLLNHNQWHLPYVGQFSEGKPQGEIQNAIKISVARCCRVSYKSFETSKESSWEEDLALYNRIAAQIPMHASPTEHQGIPDFKLKWTGWVNKGYWGNFKGWIQYRQTLPNQDLAPIPQEYR